MRPVSRAQADSEAISRALCAFRRRDRDPDDAGVAAAAGLLDLLDVEGRIEAAYAAGHYDGAAQMANAVSAR